MSLKSFTMRSIDERLEREYNRALRFLSYRPRSEKEITDFLNRKKVQLSIISKILQKLKQINLVNDEEFAKWWIEQRTGSKPRGWRLIKMELRRKGISEEIIEVQSSKSKVQSEGELARIALNKKLKSLKQLSPEQFRQKVGAFLLRRGFDFETAKGVIDEIFEKEYTKQ